MTSLALGGGWLDPEYWVSTFGMLGVLGLVFAESGLLICAALPFLPGDSLLFTTGLLVADGTFMGGKLWLVCVLITLAAMAGDQVGYHFGRKVGGSLFTRPDSRFFKQENAHKAHAFFERHGARTLILARFVPMLRTLAPIVAGVGRMNYRTFTLFNTIGAVIWGTGLTALGYFLGQIAFIRDNLTMVILSIVVLSFVPLVLEIRRGRRRSATPAPAPAADGTGAAGTGAAEPAAPESSAPERADEPGVVS